MTILTMVEAVADRSTYNVVGVFQPTARSCLRQKGRHGTRHLLVNSLITGKAKSPLEMADCRRFVVLSEVIVLVVKKPV